MTSRRNGFGLGVALSLGFFCLSFTAPAFAQDPAPPAPDATPPAPTPPSDDTAKLADAPAGAPAEEPKKGAEAPKPTEALPPPTNETASGTSVEREKAVALVGLEQLPGSAYPSVQTRGIKYGSLWLTFHGQQWPYMPLIEGGPGIRIGFSGSLWNDLSYTHINADDSQTATKDQNRWATQTRGVLRVTPTYNDKNGWFAQGNAEFVLHGDMTADVATKTLPTTDDLWIRAGKWNLFDITVGRFQGWEIANHFGMALDQNTFERSGAWITSSSFKPTDGYGLTYFWDRQDFTLGGYAAHLYPTKYLRAEVLGHIGAGQTIGTQRQMDIRPSAIFDIGYLKLKAGWEYGKSIPQEDKNNIRDTRNGYGFAAQVVLAPYVEFGGSFARGFVDELDKDSQVNLEGSTTSQTYGGFLNASPAYEPLVFGFGAFWNSTEDFRVDNTPGSHQGKVNTNDQRQIFGAVQYTLWERLYFKFVLAHAKNHIETFKGSSGGSIFTNTAMSGRFRVMLLF